MPETLLDSFAASLPEAARNFLASWISPFDFVYLAAERRKEIDQRRLEEYVEKDIDFGAPLGTKTFLMPKENVAETVVGLLDMEDQIITAEADQFLQALELESAECLLPDLTSIRALHAAHPIFGTLLAIHDNVCQVCEPHDKTSFERRTKAAEQTISALPESEQALLVEWGKRLVQRMIEVMEGDLPPELADPDSVPAIVRELRHPEGHCFVADSMTNPDMFWMTKHPYFLGQHFFGHAGICPQFRARWRQFEQTLVDLLPTAEKSVYEQTAARITGGTAHVF